MEAQDRRAFAERMRLQLLSRYPGTGAEVDSERFALHINGIGIDATLPLAPLHHAVLRDPAQTPTLIAEWVSGVEHQLTPRTFSTFVMQRVLWCVRSTSYLRTIGRADDLLTRTVAADLVAFVAEELPGSVMRGIPREEWIAAGHADSDVATVASDHTAERFARLVPRIRGAERIPADGWRMASDQLFQSSALLVPEILAALAARAEGDVLLAVPDRSVLLALPAALPSASRFGRRVLREWRESMNPCSHEVLETDGTRLRGAGHRGAGPGGWVMPWLQE
ncbi:MAG: hypothetical protein JOY80_04970 [Candidatus Dormibacteraeota bacterium]|nr:hypothetical protein [Candidatus Dormibacteraeota bacterium]